MVGMLWGQPTTVNELTQIKRDGRRQKKGERERGGRKRRREGEKEEGKDYKERKLQRKGRRGKGEMLGAIRILKQARDRVCVCKPQPLQVSQLQFNGMYKLEPCDCKGQEPLTTQRYFIDGLWPCGSLQCS